MGCDIVGYVYASIVAAGGVLGYVKSGSTPSLGAGLFFGSMLGYGAYQMSQDSSNYMLTLSTSSVLGGLMGYRYYSSGKFMPAGLVCMLSIAIITRIIVKNTVTFSVK